MEEVYRGDQLIGYNIGDDISVHRHSNAPENWVVTIPSLDISRQSLCGLDCTKPEIARYIHLILHKRRTKLDGLIGKVLPFT